MEPSILSLLPPVLTIGLAIATRRILLSLGIGIVLGALLYAEWNPLTAAGFVWDTASVLVVAEGALAEEMYILTFVVLLGVMSALIRLSGGLHAFSDWIVTKVRSRRQAQTVPLVLGVVIFFDDAFSSLVGGNISRTVTDRYRVSRAKLSYLVDSMAAPIIILAPVSAWAAVTAGLMEGILEDNGVTDVAGYEAFVRTIPANYYAIAAILLVVATALLSINIGPMRRHERRAIETGELYDTAQGPAPGETDDASLPPREDGRVSDLLLPVGTLLGVTFVVSMAIGITGSAGEVTLLNILANTNVIQSLLIAGAAACAVSIVRLLSRGAPGQQIGRAVRSGIRSMLMAAVVLFLAWTTAGIIGELGVGEYVSRGLDGDLANTLLPVMLFVLAAFLAFSMGSTFGTFALILPISAAITSAVDPALIVPSFAAVMAGAIFGDHTSPLSDTTILSSIGSGVHLIDHVKTQLPYALIAAAVAATGYVGLGLTRSTTVGLVVTLVVMALTIVALRRWASDSPEPAREEAASSHGSA